MPYNYICRDEKEQKDDGFQYELKEGEYWSKDFYNIHGAVEEFNRYEPRFYHNKRLVTMRAPACKKCRCSCSRMIKKEIHYAGDL